MIKGMDHIGIAVKDLREAVNKYGDILGLPVGEIETFEDQQVNIAFITLDETKIELLESTSSEGPVARFLAKRGEGIHHIALKVKDIQKVLNRLKKKGIRLIDEKPKIDSHGNKFAFVHPKSMMGVLIEFCE